MKKLFLFLFPFFCIAQQTDVVDFKHLEATVIPETSSQSIRGTVKVIFEIVKDTDSVYLDAHKMKVTDQALESVQTTATEDKIWFTGSFKKDKQYTAFFSYEAVPKQTLYFTGDQVWTQGQGKYTSHWLPSLDDMNDKIEFDLTVNAPRGTTVVANGNVSFYDDKPPGRELWKFDMKNPMSSYLVAFAMGDFQKKTLSSASGVPIELYIATEDTLKFEPTYRYTKAIFDFFESEIGVPYPWQNYKQVPVRDFLYAGMENTTATIFSEAFVVDSIGFTDRNYVNVNAHELAHQWFGNLVTETSGTHHWLQEGFATYYALLAEREIFGDEYYYWKLYNSAEQLKTLSDEGKGQSLLDPGASSLIFYEKGAWALHMLKELIGEADFRTAVHNYLEIHSFKNVNTSDFLNEVRNVSQTDISTWEKDWLQQTAFKAEQAFNSLVKSDFIKKYFELSSLAAIPLADKKIQLTTAVTFPNDFIGQEVIRQLADEPLAAAFPFYVKGFESNNVFVRQAIALSLPQVPEQLQTYYESLLQDSSYVTQEAALFNLWSSFPKKRTLYLNKMQTVVGFQNKNIRQLWLALAMVTPDYNSSEKENYKKELQAYTSAAFSFEVRQKAFEYVNELQLFNDEVLKNLVNAAVHHNWRFRSASRELLNLVLQNTQHKNAVLKHMNQFSAAEKTYLAQLNRE